MLAAARSAAVEISSCSVAVRAGSVCLAVVQPENDIATRAAKPTVHIRYIDPRGKHRVHPVTDGPRIGSAKAGRAAWTRWQARWAGHAVSPAPPGPIGRDAM